MAKDYIVFDEEDIIDLIRGKEVSCIMKSGELIYIISNQGYNNIINPISDEDWDNAGKHLDRIIIETACFGMADRLSLYEVLVPLKKRYDQG